jgi:hypothetical protein
LASKNRDVDMVQYLVSLGATLVVEDECHDTLSRSR